MNYFVMENMKEVLLIMYNFDGQLEPKHIIFSVQLFLKLVILAVKLELQLVILVGKLLLKLLYFGGKLMLKLMSFDWQLVNYWIGGALPDLILIALFIALIDRHDRLLLKKEEAKKLKRLLKRKKAERKRLSELKKRQKQRVKEMRETQKKELENMNLKMRIRAEVGKELNKLEMTCCDMASVLRGLGITVGDGTSNEVRVAYKKALLKFHPDRASRSDIQQQVEAEEKFKLISRMKDKYLPTL